MKGNEDMIDTGYSIDEAMMSLSDMVQEFIAPFQQDTDKELDVSNSLTRLTLDMPVQIQVAKGPDGNVLFGITPPLYSIDTSFNPIFHQIRFTCENEK